MEKNFLLFLLVFVLCFSASGCLDSSSSSEWVEHEYRDISYIARDNWKKVYEQGVPAHYFAKRDYLMVMDLGVYVYAESKEALVSAAQVFADELETDFVTLEDWSNDHVSGIYFELYYGGAKAKKPFYTKGALFTYKNKIYVLICRVETDQQDQLGGDFEEILASVKPKE